MCCTGHPGHGPIGPGGIQNLVGARICVIWVNDKHEIAEDQSMSKLNNFKPSITWVIHFYPQNGIFTRNYIFDLKSNLPILPFFLHTAKERFIKSIKLGGTGLIEYKLKWIIGTHGHWKNQNPGGRFGATS